MTGGKPGPPDDRISRQARRQIREIDLIGDQRVQARVVEQSHRGPQAAARGPTACDEIGRLGRLARRCSRNRLL